MEAQLGRQHGLQRWKLRHDVGRYADRSASRGHGPAAFHGDARPLGRGHGHGDLDVRLPRLVRELVAEQGDVNDQQLRHAVARHGEHRPHAEDDPHGHPRAVEARREHFAAVGGGHHARDHLVEQVEGRRRQQHGVDQGDELRRCVLRRGHAHGGEEGREDPLHPLQAQVRGGEVGGQHGDGAGRAQAQGQRGGGRGGGGEHDQADALYDRPRGRRAVEHGQEDVFGPRDPLAEGREPAVPQVVVFVGPFHHPGQDDEQDDPGQGGGRAGRVAQAGREDGP